LLVVLVLDTVEFLLIVSEDTVVLGVEAILKALSVQDGFKLPKELKSLLNVLSLLELLINVFLKLSFNSADINIELNKVTIERVLSIIKQLVVLILELVDNFLKFVQNWLDILKLVHTKGLELLDGAEQFNELSDTSAEEVEFSKDLCWGEIKLFRLWHVLEALLGELILTNIAGMELKALVENSDKFITWVLVAIPKHVIVHLRTFLGGNWNTSSEFLVV